MGEEKPTTSLILPNQQKEIFYVDFGVEFDYFYNNVFSNEKLDLIDDFIEHYEVNGLNNWKGKISHSANVPDSYPDAQERRDLALQYNLHHAHIGLPTWHPSRSGLYKTSDQVLHFQKVSYSEILLLTVSTHNPMELPTIDQILGK